MEANNDFNVLVLLGFMLKVRFKMNTIHLSEKVAKALKSGIGKQDRSFNMELVCKHGNNLIATNGRVLICLTNGWQGEDGFYELQGDCLIQPLTLKPQEETFRFPKCQEFIANPFITYDSHVELPGFSFLTELLTLCIKNRLFFPLFQAEKILRIIGKLELNNLYLHYGEKKPFVITGDKSADSKGCGYKLQAVFLSYNPG